MKPPILPFLCVIPLLAAPSLFAKPLAQSRVIKVGDANPTQQLVAKVPKGQLKELWLEVNDAGDGYSHDWAGWCEPVLSGPAGKMKLTDLKWQSGSTGWGKLNLHKDPGGGPLVAKGKTFAFGIGAHANSLIHYRIPKGYDTLTVTLD